MRGGNFFSEKFDIFNVDRGWYNEIIPFYAHPASHKTHPSAPMLSASEAGTGAAEDTRELKRKGGVSSGKRTEND